MVSMSRPTYLYINQAALLHNFRMIQKYSNNKKIIAMVKANAYGLGIKDVVPTLAQYVDGFGVACSEEAMEIRQLGLDVECILFQGLFDISELDRAYKYRFQVVLSKQRELEWLLTKPAHEKIKVWVKVNTGMHRLGFAVEEVAAVIERLRLCPWVDSDINLMTHLACADEPNSKRNTYQLEKFSSLTKLYVNMPTSIANSAAIIGLPKAHGDIVRAGIMLYGVSPYSHQLGVDLGLQPVMRFVSKIVAIYHYEKNSPIGYGATWQSDKPTVIGVVPVGYGDGYPRHIKENTKVWVKGLEVPIVGRISMDMMTIDLTDYQDIQLDDEVELWGTYIPVEKVANAADTIAYELLTQVSNRVIRKHEVIE